MKFFTLITMMVSLFGILGYAEATCKCELQREEGFGSNPSTRYYYNTYTNKCEKFTYNGEGGNQNNFEGLIECSNTCAGQICHDDSLATWCSMVSITQTLLPNLCYSIEFLSRIYFLQRHFIIKYTLLDRKKEINFSHPYESVFGCLATTPDPTIVTFRLGAG